LGDIDNCLLVCEILSQLKIWGRHYLLSSNLKEICELFRKNYNAISGTLVIYDEKC
jgi:hypothetical protein